MFFNWPPSQDGGFPDAAMEVGLARMRTDAAGKPWNGVTADVLRDLNQPGLISAEGLAHGLDALSKSSGQDSTTALPTVREAARAVATATAGGTGTGEAALYL